MKTKKPRRRRLPAHVSWLVLLLLAGGRPAAAKCDRRQVYYCVPVKFESENARLKQPGANPGLCAGYVGWNDQHAAVVFKEPGPCPVVGTQIIGHLENICQDTGHWTEATHWYIDRPVFCKSTYKEMLNQAHLTVGMIRPGVPRNQVHEWMKGYEFLDGTMVERYYGHPNVVIQIP